MASIRMQIFAAVEVKLTAVVAALGWETMLVNPREPVGEDEMNAIVMAYGGEPDPGGLTGHVSTHETDFSVGLVVREAGVKPAEQLLDEGYVAVSDALLDPDDIQLGGLAVGIRRGGMSEPFVGRGRNGAMMVGVQEIGFTVQYWGREGDASAPGP